jgi:TolB protein
VRDCGDDTAVVIKYLDSGEETLINSAAIDLDPEFSDNGNHLYCTSGISGSLELHQSDIKSDAQQLITALPAVVKMSDVLPINKASFTDAVMVPTVY